MSINARLVLHFVVYLGKAGKRGAMPERQQPLFQPEKRERATVFMKLKKYIKSIVVFFITLIGIILGIILGIRFLQFFMPFVIGWIIAMIANPLVRILERRLKVARKHTSMLIIIGVLALVVTVLYFLGVKIGEETRDFLDQAPEMYSDFTEDFQNAGENLEIIISELPENIQESLEEVQQDIGTITGQAVGKLSQFTVDKAGSFARNIPSILISMIFSILSAYFFIADRDRILEFGRAHTPQIIQEKWRMMAESFKIVFGGYFKAQFKIMAVIGVILFHRVSDIESEVCHFGGSAGGFSGYAAISWNGNSADPLGGVQISFRRYPLCSGAGDPLSGHSTGPPDHRAEAGGGFHRDGSAGHIDLYVHRIPYRRRHRYDPGSACRSHYPELL